MNSLTAKLLVSFALLLLFSCSDEKMEIKKDMVEFERAYIPALFYTEKNDTAKSLRAIVELQVAWERFDNRRHRDFQDSTWRNAFNKAGAMISRADGLLNTSTDTKSAHEALEEVRAIMGELRTEYSIRIYSDYLTDFHKPMQTLLSFANNLTADTLTDSTLSLLIQSISKANSSWAVIDTLTIESDLYGFSETKHVEIQNATDELSSQLTILTQITKNRGNNLNKDEIVKATSLIKQSFVKIYKPFGRFYSDR